MVGTAVNSPIRVGPSEWILDFPQECLASSCILISPKVSFHYDLSIAAFRVIAQPTCAHLIWSFKPNRTGSGGTHNVERPNGIHTFDWALETKLVTSWDPHCKCPAWTEIDLANCWQVNGAVQCWVYSVKHNRKGSLAVSCLLKQEKHERWTKNWISFWPPILDETTTQDVEILTRLIYLSASNGWHEWILFYP